MFASGSGGQAGDEDSVGKRHSRPIRATDNVYLRVELLHQGFDQARAQSGLLCPRP
jgi:hypothetical protein